MAKKFNEMVCVVTGANRGIGLEFVKQLLAGGAHVFAGVRDPSKATELHRVHTDHQSQLKIIELNIATDASVAKFKSVVDHELTQLNGRLDLLINNAGIYVDSTSSATGAKALGETSTEKMLESFNVNTIGPIRMTRAFLPALKKSAHGRIAHISSQMGSIAESSGGAVAYRMSKAALNMFVKSLSIDEPELVSLTLHPGWVQTDMGGQAAPVKPETSVEGLLKVIMGADRKLSGHFLRYDGKEAPW